MATYREIHGKAVKSLSTDPSAETDAGQIWYNTSSDTFKSIVNLEAWSSGSALVTARYGAGGAGTQTAGLCIAGNVGPTDTRTTLVEEYNGSGWATGGALPTATRSFASAGTQTAAFAAGGYDTANTAEAYTYNGTAWTGIPALNTARRSLNCMGSGTTTAGLVAGGLIEPPFSAASEEYNGSSWSEGEDLNTAKSTGGSAGTQTATILAGGIKAPGSTLVAASEQYDGTSWTDGPNINTARQGLGAAGTQTSAIIVAGRTPDKNATETWDGTSWTTSPATLATARYDVAPTNAGPSSTWMVAGGYGPSSVRDLTEEYNNSASVITAAAWSSGTNFPTTSSAVSGAGPRDAAIGIGGYPAGSPPTGKSFEYDGTSWSAEATLNSNTGTLGVSSATGTQTAVINAQNGPGPAPPYVYSAAGEYDGSSWSNANNRPGDNYSQAMAGTQTAGLIFGGTSSPTGTMDATFSYDGTNWTAEEAMNTARSEIAGSGTATAALGSAGYSNPPGTVYANTEEYGGESWTASNALLYVVRNGRSSGTQTDAIYMGGGTPSLPLGIVNCLTYDGTSWATAPSMATSRQNQGNGATSPVGAAWGAAGYYPGSTPNRTNTTEHFNVETTAINVKTLTQS